MHSEKAARTGQNGSLRVNHSDAPRQLHERKGHYDTEMHGEHQTTLQGTGIVMSIPASSFLWLIRAEPRHSASRARYIVTMQIDVALSPSHDETCDRRTVSIGLLILVTEE
jgi:hypothetical protein